MRSKVVLSLSILLFILLVSEFVFRERWTTPADELRCVLGYYYTLSVAQKSYFSTQGRYADLSRLIGVGPRGYRLREKCQDHYCFEVKGFESKYTIRIFPDKSESPPRRLSLYADETDVIRIAYGSPFAHPDSAVLSQDEIERFRPR